MKRMKKLTLAGISFLSIAVFAACHTQLKSKIAEVQSLCTIDLS